MANLTKFFGRRALATLALSNTSSKSASPQQEQSDPIRIVDFHGREGDIDARVGRVEHKLGGVPVSWCDKLASTPSIGFSFSPHYAPSTSILEAIAPILNGTSKAEKQMFNIDSQDAFGLTFTTEDGYHYGFDASKLYVEFRYRLRAKNVSGGPPVVEMLSKPQPFTQMLPEVSRRLIEVTGLLTANAQRPLRRIGVVSTTIVAEEEMPPGFLRYIKYASKPWKDIAEYYSFQIITTLAKSEGWVDRCVHNISKPDEPDALVTLKIDWQRQFSSPRVVTTTVLKDLSAAAQEAALAYFEDVAEGNRFDVNATI